MSTEDAILARLDEHGRLLVEIKDQATRTNGRVTALERVNIARDAAAAALEKADEQRTRSRSWWPSTGTSLLIFAGGVAVERFL